MSQTLIASPSLFHWNGDDYQLDTLSFDQLEDLFSDICDAGYYATDASVSKDCSNAWRIVSNELADRNHAQSEVEHNQNETSLLDLFTVEAHVSNDNWQLVGWNDDDNDQTCMYPACTNARIAGDVLCQAHADYADSIDVDDELEMREVA